MYKYTDRSVPVLNKTWCVWSAETSLCTVFDPIGYPHFMSFDGAVFSYQGTCKYNLASPCNESLQPYFNVFAKNEDQPNVNSSVSILSYVEIIYNSTVVRLSRMASLSTLAPAPVFVTVSPVELQQTDTRLMLSKVALKGVWLWHIIATMRRCSGYPGRPKQFSFENLHISTTWMPEVRLHEWPQCKYLPWLRMSTL